MNQEQLFIHSRGSATVAVQIQIAASWVWPEKTVVQWQTELAAIITQDEVAQDARAALDGERGNLTVAVAEMSRLGRQVLGLARTRYRHVPATLNLFDNIRFDSNGREAILKDALDTESAWEQADPAWVPLNLPAVPPAAPVPLTLTLFKSKRLAARGLMDSETLKEKAWQKQEQVLDDLCRVLNDANVHWYADATLLFAAGTVEGDLIRAGIPTTYSPPSAPPGQCVFTELVSPAAGALRSVLAAPGADTFDTWLKAPGAPAFVKVADLTASGTYETTGLAAGVYTVKGQGHNSGGYGPMSAEQTVAVG